MNPVIPLNAARYSCPECRQPVKLPLLAAGPQHLRGASAKCYSCVRSTKGKGGLSCAGIVEG
jgi:hypothetical protein